MRTGTLGLGVMWGQGATSSGVGGGLGFPWQPRGWGMLLEELGEGGERVEQGSALGMEQGPGMGQDPGMENGSSLGMGQDPGMGQGSSLGTGSTLGGRGTQPQFLR